MNNDITLGDYLDFECPVDANVVMVDPPYGIGKKYDDKKETKSYATHVNDLVKWSTAPWTIIFGPWPTLHDWMPHVPKPDRILVWHRTWTQPRGTTHWTHSITPILIYVNDYARWNGPSRSDRLWHDCIDAHSSMGDTSRQRSFNLKCPIRHPGVTGTSISIKILKCIVSPGDHVVDPMCGLGSILVSAKRLGCKISGYEIVSEYKKYATKWLDAETDRT